MVAIADASKDTKQNQYFIELDAKVISQNASMYKREKLGTPAIDLYNKVLRSKARTDAQGFASGYDISFDAFERMLGTYKTIHDELCGIFNGMSSDRETKKFLNLFSFYIAASSAEKVITKHTQEKSPVSIGMDITLFERDYSLFKEMVDRYIDIGRNAYGADDLAKRTSGFFNWIQDFTRTQLERAEFAGLMQGLERKGILNPDVDLKFMGLNYVDVRKQRSGRILTLDDIGGNYNAKSEIYMLIERFKDEDECAANNIDIYEGIMFEGPPGTGKTLLAKILADNCGKNFVEIQLTDFLSKFWGETEENLRKILSVKNSIIFFDEMDSTCPRQSGDDTEGMMRRITDQVAKHLQGFQDDKSSSRNVYIAATNFRDGIATKILRAGRFDKIVEFNYPDETEIQEILDIHLRRSDAGSRMAFFEDIDSALIARAIFARSLQVKAAAAANPKLAVQGLVGADIEQIVKRARSFRWNAKYLGHPVHPATNQDFMDLTQKYEAEKRG
ncbi:MAG: ATP-binding protein [Nanoarchaeota archaeon]|nr:ATP-binding protein [Nanoarchaeota archaeon]